MALHDSEINEIIEKYRKDEEKIENSLRLIDEKNHNSEKSLNDSNVFEQFPSFEAAKERNKTILKDLEIVKGNLRSKAIFSPTELQWEEICKRYQQEPSLPVKTWRCNLPTFV